MLPSDIFRIIVMFASDADICIRWHKICNPKKWDRHATCFGKNAILWENFCQGYFSEYPKSKFVQRESNEKCGKIHFNHIYLQL